VLFIHDVTPTSCLDDIQLIRIVLVALEQLAFDLVALDAVLGLHERLVGARLQRVVKMQYPPCTCLIER